MDDIFKVVRDQKTKAKNKRDARLYGQAVSFLEEAISQLKEESAVTSETARKSRLHSELADCYGLIGGVQRRWGLESKKEQERKKHLAESVKAYENGYSFEKSEEKPESEIVNSYNMLNRLVSRILYDPKTLTGSSLKPGQKIIGPLDVRGELKKAEEVIRGQLKEERRGDVWALADLALLSLLLDRAAPTSAYVAFHAVAPPDYVYESALSTLCPLSQLELPIEKKIERGCQAT